MAKRLEAPRTNFQDAVMAKALTVGSAVAYMFPAVNFVGKAKAPSYTPVYWHHSRKPFDAENGAWAHYDGIHSSGVTPRHYGAAALILVDREAMDTLRERKYAGRENDAVVYRLGTTTMVGISYKYEVLGLEHEDDEDYKVALRIGKGPLDAQVGVEVLGGGSSIAQPARLYTPLERGVRPGPIMPIDEIPEQIPLV